MKALFARPRLAEVLLCLSALLLANSALAQSQYSITLYLYYDSTAAYPADAPWCDPSSNPSTCIPQQGIEMCIDTTTDCATTDADGSATINYTAASVPSSLYMCLTDPSATNILAGSTDLQAFVGEPDLSDCVRATNLTGADERAVYVEEVSADLQLTIGDTPDPVLAGSGADNLTYTLELENLGPSDATNVSVSVTPNLPAGVTVSGSTASVGTFDGSTWTVGPLAAAGPSVTLALNLTVDNSASSCTDCISVTATATTADQADSDPSNNTDIVGTTSIETAADGVTSFMTTITFSNGYTGSAMVTLSCNSGVPLEQSFEISPSLPVNFKIETFDFTDPDAVCQVTLDALDDGYVGSSFTANTVLTDGACRYSGSPEAGEAAFDTTTARMNTCAIVAEPVASTFEVSKRWLFEGNNDGSEIDQRASIHIYCLNAALDTGSVFTTHSWDVSPTGDDDFSYDIYPSPNGDTTCAAEESGLDSAVESDQGCANAIEFEVGDGAKGCTITNTVFFEGIPTLSPWGLAILTVLTLGVGLVGLRRFA